MQPYLFPYLGYFQLMSAVDRFVVYDDVNYIKGGWVNRNRVRVGSQALYFTLPPQGASPNRKICEIGLGNVEHWRRKFLRGLQQEYRRAPCFVPTYELVEEVCGFETDNLSEFVVNSLLRVRERLGIETEFVATSRGYGNEELRGPERVLDICAREAIDLYVNPIGGRPLYDAATFREQRVELRFLQSRPVEYDQGGKTFLPWLSIIDVMMCNPPARIAEFLELYDLVE